MTSHSVKEFDAATGVGATSKDAVAKLVKAWESKNGQRAVRGSGLGLMAVTLAACGGSDAPAPTTPTTPATPAPTPVSAAFTTAIDALVGTAANDTFSGSMSATAAANTLTSADSIVGGGGVDTLTITVDTHGAGVTLAAPTSTGVEVIAVRNVSGQTVTGDVSNFVGATTFEIANSTSAVVLNNIGAADVTIRGNGGTEVSDVTLTVAAGTGTTIVTDAFTLNVVGGTVDATASNFYVNDDDADWTVANIISSGASNTLDDVNLSGVQATAGTHTVTTLNITADAALRINTLTGFDADATINVAGASTGTVRLGTMATNVDTINAATFAGGVRVVLDAETNTVFTGGLGNDHVTTGAALVTGTVAAGAGSDTLVIANSAHVNSTTLGARYTGFETLQVGAGVAVDVDNLSAGNTFTAATFAAGGEITDMTAAMAANITAEASGTYVIGVKNATTVGNVDSVVINATDGLATTSTIALGTPTVAGVERLSITATDNVTVTALTGVASIDTLTLAGAGTLGVTTGALAVNSNMSVSAAAATGAITFDADLSTGRGMNVTTGAGNDTITMSDDGLSDVIVAGAGNDTIRADGVGVADAQTITITEAVGGGTDAAIAVTFHGVTVTTAVIDADVASVTNIATAIAAALNANAALVADGFSFTSAAGVVTSAGSGLNGAVGDFSVNDGTITGFTYTVAGTNGAAPTVAADTITLGAGSDTVNVYASSQANMDTITDLNLGGNSAATAVDTLVFTNVSGTAAVATATTAQAATIAAQANLAAAVDYVLANVATTDGSVSIFTYGSSQYLVMNGDGGATYTDTVDAILNVTGFTGTLDTSDFSFI